MGNTTKYIEVKEFYNFTRICMNGKEYDIHKSNSPVLNTECVTVYDKQTDIFTKLVPVPITQEA